MEGTFICPEGAACFAAVGPLRESGWIGADDEVVVLNTGAGVKYPETVTVDAPLLAKDGPRSPGRLHMTIGSDLDDLRGDRFMKRPFLAVTAVAACLATGACGIKPATAGRDRDTLVIDTTNYPTTLDPGKQYDTDTYSVYRNIFDQLLRRDPRTGTVKPWLATSWKQTDPTTWTFQIRPGMTFSDGTPAHGGGRGVQHQPDPGQEVRQPAVRELLGDQQGHRAGPDPDRAHDRSLADAAELPDHAVGGAREATSSRSATRSSPPSRSAPGRTSWPRPPPGHRCVLQRQPALVGAEAADARGACSAPCRTSPAASPTCSRARPTWP